MGNTVVVPSYHDWYTQPLRKQRITLLDHLDAGQFFLVFEGKNSQNQDIIVKAYEYNEPLQKFEKIKYSRKYFKKLSDHSTEVPGIVNFSFLVQDNMAFLFRPKFEKSFNFVEFCSYQQPILEPIEKLFIFYQIYSIIKSLHSIDLAHGDLKPSNIFVNGHDLDLCIVDPAPFKPDFILEASLHIFYHYFTTSSDSGCYLAPERIIGIFQNNQSKSSSHQKNSQQLKNQNKNTETHKGENNNNSKGDANNKKGISANDDSNLNINSNHIDMKMADIFSFGCIIAFLYLNGEHIFDLSKLHNYANGKIDIRKDLAPIGDENIINIIMGLISLDIEERRETMSKLDDIFEYFFEIFSKLFCEYRNDESFKSHPQEHMPKFTKVIHELFENGRLLLFNFFFDQLLKMDQIQSIIYSVQEITKFITYTKITNEDSDTKLDTERSPPPSKLAQSPFKSIQYPENGGISASIKLTRAIPLFLTTIRNNTGSPLVFRQCIFSILDILRTIDQIPPFLKDYIKCYLKIEFDKLIILNKSPRLLPTLANIAPFYIYRLKRFVTEDALLPLSSSFSGIFGQGSTPYVFSIFAHSMITIAHIISNNNKAISKKYKEQRKKDSKVHKAKTKEKAKKHSKDGESNDSEEKNEEKHKEKSHKDKKKDKDKDKTDDEGKEKDKKGHKDKKKDKTDDESKEKDEKSHKDKKKDKEKTDEDEHGEKSHKDKKKPKDKDKTDDEEKEKDEKSHKDKKKDKTDDESKEKDEKIHKDKKKPKDKEKTDDEEKDEKSHKDKTDDESKEKDEKIHKDKKKDKDRAKTDDEESIHKAKKKDKEKTDEKSHKDKKKAQTDDEEKNDDEHDEKIHKDKKKTKDKAKTDDDEKNDDEHDEKIHKLKKKAKTDDENSPKKDEKIHKAKKKDKDHDKDEDDKHHKDKIKKKSKDDDKKDKEKKKDKDKDDKKKEKKKDKDKDKKKKKESHKDKKKKEHHHTHEYDDIYSDEDFEDFYRPDLPPNDPDPELDTDTKPKPKPTSTKDDKNIEYHIFDYDTEHFDSGFTIFNSFFFYILSVYNDTDVYCKKEALKIILEFYKCSKYNVEDQKKYHQIFIDSLFPILSHILSREISFIKDGNDNKEAKQDEVDLVIEIFDFLRCLCDSNKKIYSLSEAPLDSLCMFSYSLCYQFYNIALEYYKKTTDPIVRYNSYQFMKILPNQIKDFIFIDNFLSDSTNPIKRVASNSTISSYKKRVSYINNGEFWSFQSNTIKLSQIKHHPLITSNNYGIQVIKNKKPYFSPRFVASFHAEMIPISHVLCTSGLCVVIDKSNRVRWISLPQIFERQMKEEPKNNIDINFNFLFHNERFVNNVQQLSQIRSTMLREKVTAASMLPRFTSPFNSTSFLLGYDNGSIDQHDLSTCQKSRIFDGFNRVLLTSRSSNMSRDSVSVPALNSTTTLNSTILNHNALNSSSNSNNSPVNSSLFFSDSVSDSAIISIKPISENCIVFANKRGSIRLIDTRTSDSFLSLSFDPQIGGIADICTWNGVMVGAGFQAGAISLIDTRMFQPFVFNVIKSNSIRRIIPVNSKSDQIRSQNFSQLTSSSFLVLNDENEQVAEVYREPLNNVVLTYNCAENKNDTVHKIREAIPFAGGAIAVDDISASFITLNTNNDHAINKYDIHQSKRIYDEYVLPINADVNEESEINLSIRIPVKSQNKTASVHMHSGKVTCACSYHDRNTSNNGVISCDDLGFVNLWNVTSG